MPVKVFAGIPDERMIVVMRAFKIFMLTAMAALMLGFCLTAAASETGSAAGPSGKGICGEMSKEKCEQLRKEMEERQNAFAKLTDAQKKAVYDMAAQIDKLQQQMLDKYVEYGIISAEEAKIAKEHMAKKAADMKEKGIMPGLFHGKRFK